MTAPVRIARSISSSHSLPQLFEVDDSRNAWRLAKAANDNVDYGVDVGARRLTQSITARTTGKITLEWLSHFALLGLRLFDAGLTVIECDGDARTREDPSQELTAELEDSRQRLQEWEQQRRHLRWYNTDDLNLMPYLDAAIGRLRHKVDGLKRLQQIRALELQLRMLPESDVEAVQLRQRIADLKSVDAIPILNSTAARAQAGGDGSVPAATDSSSGKERKDSQDPFLPDGLAEFLTLDNPKDPNILEYWRQLLDERHLTPEQQDQVKTFFNRIVVAGGVVNASWDAAFWNLTRILYLHGNSEYWATLASLAQTPDVTGEAASAQFDRWLDFRMNDIVPGFTESEWGVWEALLRSGHVALASPLLEKIEACSSAIFLKNYLHISGHWGSIKLLLNLFVRGDAPLAHMASYDPLLQLSLVYWMAGMPGLDPDMGALDSIIDRATHLVRELSARGVTIQGDVLLLAMLEWHKTPGAHEQLQFLETETHPGDFVYLDTRDYPEGGPIQIEVLQPESPGATEDAPQLLTMMLVREKVVHPFDRWPLFWTLCEAPPVLVKLAVKEGLNHPHDIAKIIQSFGLQDFVDDVNRYSQASLAFQTESLKGYASPAVKPPQFLGRSIQPRQPLKITMNKVQHDFHRILQESGDAALVYPHVPHLRYDMRFDPLSLLDVIQFMKDELLAPQPLSFDVSHGNRELIALATLRYVAGSSALVRLLNVEERGDALSLYPTLVEWVGSPQPNGRHFLAMDTYLALISAGMLTLDLRMIHTLLFEDARWSVEQQKFVYRLLLNPNTPQAIVDIALSRLHTIVTDVDNKNTKDPVEAALLLGGIEMLASHQGLSGSETKAAAEYVRHMMLTASPDIQKMALMTYMAVVNSGYLSSEDVQGGIVDMVTVSESDKAPVAALALGTLIQMASWVEPATLSRLQIKPASLGSSPQTDMLNARRLITLAALHEAVARPTLPQVPLATSSDWGDIWHDLEYGDELFDLSLSQSAHVFGFSFSMMWSPQLDEAHLDAAMQRKIELVSDDPADVAYLKTQRDVVEKFITSPRRGKLWERIARGDDGVAKQKLLGMCEQRLKKGGADDDLSEFQRVRNILLNRPEMSSGEMQLDRLYLTALWTQMNRDDHERAKWYATVELKLRHTPTVMSSQLWARYFAHELAAPQSVSGVSLEVQQLVVLRSLWNLLENGGSENANWVYQRVAPLLVSENNEVAYAAAMVADRLEKGGAKIVDTLRVQYLLLRSELLVDSSDHGYPDGDVERLEAIGALVRHQMLSPKEIKGAVPFISDALDSRSETLELVVIRIAPDVVKSGEVEPELVTDIAVTVLIRLRADSTDIHRESYLATLRGLSAYVSSGKYSKKLLQETSEKLSPPWRERALQALDLLND